MNRALAIALSLWLSVAAAGAVARDMAGEAQFADQIGMLYRQGDFAQVEVVLERELASARAASGRDPVRELLITHELAELALRHRFNFERAADYIVRARTLLALPDLAALFRQANSYKDVERAVNNRMTVSYTDYVLLYRHMSLDALRGAIDGLAADLERVTRDRGVKTGADDLAEMRSFIKELIEASRQTSGRTERGQILARLALLNFRIGEAAQARAYLAQLFAHTATSAATMPPGAWDPYLPPQLQVELLHLAAVSQRQGGEHRVALALWERAITVYETFRSSMRGEENRIEIFSNLGSLYANALDAALDAGEPDKVALLAERSKSRALADALRGRTSFMRSEHITMLARFDSASANNVDASGKRNASVLLDAEPELASAMTFSDAFLPGADVIDTVRKRFPDTAVLMYFETASGLAVVVLDRDGVKARRLPISRTQIEQARTRLFRQGTERIIFTPDKAALGALYQGLMAPILPLIETARHLVIIPPGLLNNVPLNALYDGKQYLIERWSVSNSPSLSALAVLLNKQVPKEPRALVIGNPDYSGRLPQLAYAETEARAIAAVWPNSVLLTGAAASESYVRRRAGEFGILHFATHGKFIATNPLKSFVMFAQDGGDDGLLEAQEIFSMNLANTALVVLSACESSVAKVRAGDEMIGFFRAFAYAGVPALIASQWEVDDRAANELMVEFYRLAKSGQEFGAALRGAQLLLLRQGRPVDHWAPFQLTGNAFLRFE